MVNKNRIVGKLRSNEDTVLGHGVVVDLTLRIRKLVNVPDINRWNVFKIIFKIKFVHELNKNDFDRRLQFSELMIERAQN